MTPARDKEGYLENPGAWNRQVADELARESGIVLTPSHWELIELIRCFYADYEVSPAMRVLVKHVRERFGEDKGNSIYLMELFPGSPAKLLAKVAGLPRPTNCL